MPFFVDFRPSASKIRDALLDANIVCLKREVAISREQSVECTAARKFTAPDNSNKIEVWVGSGETEQSQISWFTLGVDKKQVMFVYKNYHILYQSIALPFYRLSLPHPKSTFLIPINSLNIIH